jgi:hypothetical protein
MVDFWRSSGPPLSETEPGLHQEFTESVIYDREPFFEENPAVVVARADPCLFGR